MVLNSVAERTIKATENKVCEILQGLAQNLPCRRFWLKTQKTR